jgi:hypothetical protein
VGDRKRRYKRQRRNPAVTEIVKVPNRGHALTIDHGWREVAQIALNFVERSLRGGDVLAEGAQRPGEGARQQFRSSV